MVLSPIEVKCVLKSLASGKASDPNIINNRIIKEQATEISVPLCDLFNLSPQEGICKEGNVCYILKKNDHSPLSIYGTKYCLTSKIKFLKYLSPNIQSDIS